MGEGNRVLLSASKSISYSIFIQFTFRIATFLINALIVRFVSKDIIGIVHVRLGLLYTTIYCLSSEPFVRACLSRPDVSYQKCKGRLNSKSSLNHVINLLWLSIPVSLLWVFLCSTVWLFYLDWPNSSITSFYQSAVMWYALAAFIEILSEPIRILTQILLLVRVKPFTEGLSLVVENSVLIIGIIFLPSFGLLSFCISKICYSLTTTISYYAYICWKIKNNCGILINDQRNINDDDDLKDDSFPFSSFQQLLPKKLQYEHKNTEGLHLLWSFSKQVVLKQGFTEGEKYIMTVFGILSFSDQGVYSIVSNLSSMAVRLLFLPMEEGFYLFLSQSLVRTSCAKLQDKESLNLVSRSLEAMLKVRTLLGITATTFGFTCSFVALDIIFGERLSSPPGPSLLKWSCFYIFLVSVNGITEGFHNASTNQEQVDKYNKVMMMYSLAFLITSYLFTNYFQLGAIGFYLSNYCNMLLRIAYSVSYINKYFEDTCYRPIRGLLPSPPVLFAYVASFFITYVSEMHFCHSGHTSYVQRLAGYFLHLVVVAFALGSTSLVIYKTERSLVMFLKEEYIQKRKIKSN